MKRFAVLAAVLLVAGVLAYGVGVARQEAVYRAFVEKGDEALAADDGFAAIEAFSAAISHKADSMAAYLKRGEAYRRRGEYESALRDLRRAVQLDPLAPHPREILGDVHYATGRYMNAVDHYREYLDLDDRSPRVLYKLALTQIKLGQPDAAVKSLRSALGFDDRFAEAHYLLGVCFMELRRPAEALAALKRAVDLNAAFLEAREELAETYQRLGRGAQRNEQLEALAILDPAGHRDVAVAVGYARDGDFDGAVTRLTSAIKRFSDDPQPHLALGRLWLERAERGGDRIDLTKALRALESATNHDSGSEAHMLHGRALLLAGEVARAERTLIYATSRLPVEPLAYYYLAEAAQRRGHLPIAQRALMDFAALEGLDSPRFDAAHLARLAEAYLAAGDTTAAHQALEHAHEKLAPRRPR